MTLPRAAFHPLEKVVTDAFHSMYYYSPHTWNGGMTTWKGVPVLQNPLDMWVKQETIHQTNPDIIIETGSACGGSALFYTDIFPKLKVISIDTQDEMQPQCKPPRVTFIKGMSTNKQIYASVKQQVKGKRVMVILDSDHTTKNVLAEMRLYGLLVTPSCYMIVEDTNIDSPPVNHPNFTDNGPMGAIEQFMKECDDFIIDHNKEKFYMTFYPNGWLLKK